MVLRQTIKEKRRKAEQGTRIEAGRYAVCCSCELSLGVRAERERQQKAGNGKQRWTDIGWLRHAVLERMDREEIPTRVWED